MNETSDKSIEHVVRKPAISSHRRPLLLLHGAWHGAWCWECFLDRFSSLGYETHAISLPGHGRSTLDRDHIDNYSFDDYSLCLASAIEKMDPAPVVVGHSLGGALLQHYMESHSLPGAVLLASIPVAGFLKGFLRMAWAYPWQAVKSGKDGYALVEKPDMAARFFLSHNTPTDVHRFHSQLVRESAPASQRTLKPILLRPEKVRTPVLVIAGGKDFIISAAEQRRTAEALNADYRIFPEGPHDLMMEPGWQAVADAIDAWLSQKGI